MQAGRAASRSITCGRGCGQSVTALRWYLETISRSLAAAAPEAKISTGSGYHYNFFRLLNIIDAHILSKYLDFEIIQIRTSWLIALYNLSWAQRHQRWSRRSPFLGPLALIRWGGSRCPAAAAHPNFHLGYHKVSKSSFHKFVYISNEEFQY